MRLMNGLLRVERFRGLVIVLAQPAGKPLGPA